MSSDQVNQSIDAAVAEGVAIRSKFLESLGEADEQAFGDRATEEELAAVESLLGRPLPPSYAAFLRRYGKWVMFDPATDLLSAREVVKEANSRALKRWREIAIDTEGLDAARWFLIGKSRSTASKYFLDPSSVDDAGEMKVYEHDRTLAEEYPNFLACLVDTNKQYREGLDDIQSSGDFDFSKI